MSFEVVPTCEEEWVWMTSDDDVDVWNFLGNPLIRRVAGVTDGDQDVDAGIWEKKISILKLKFKKFILLYYLYTIKANICLSLDIKVKRDTKGRKWYHAFRRGGQWFCDDKIKALIHFSPHFFSFDFLFF